MAHYRIHSAQKAEAGGSLSSRPAWSTKWVPGQSGIHRETLSGKKKNRTKQTQENLANRPVLQMPETVASTGFKEDFDRVILSAQGCVTDVTDLCNPLYIGVNRTILQQKDPLLYS